MAPLRSAMVRNGVGGADMTTRCLSDGDDG